MSNSTPPPDPPLQPIMGIVESVADVADAALEAQRRREQIGYEISKPFVPTTSQVINPPC